MKLKHRWMESLDSAIRMNEDARRWAPRLLLFGVLTSIPAAYLMLIYGLGDDPLAKFMRFLYLVLPITGLGTGSLYFAFRGLHGAILEMPIEGDWSSLHKRLEGALEGTFERLGLAYIKGVGRPEARVTYKLPQGINVQILSSGEGGEHVGQTLSIGVRIYGVFEDNRSTAQDLECAVDGMPLWSEIKDILRADIMDDPGYWEL